MLIRRFEVLQCIDRTQFEGARKRYPGELSNWAGPGPSKLRKSITLEELKNEEDLDEEPRSYFDVDSLYDCDYDSDRTVCARPWRTLSAEMKEAGWEDDFAHSMDIVEEVRLF